MTAMFMELFAGTRAFVVEEWPIVTACGAVLMGFACYNLGYRRGVSDGLLKARTIMDKVAS